MRPHQTNKNTIKLVVVLLTSFFTANSYAQWAVRDDALISQFANGGSFREFMDKKFNQLQNATSEGSATTDILRKQQAQMQQDTDARDRLAQNQSATGQKIAEIFPTLDRCRELSASNGVGSPSGTGGGGKKTGGGAPSPTDTEALKRAIKSETDKVVQPLLAKKAAGTCSLEDVASKIPGCAAVGDFGGSTARTDGAQPASDVSPISLLGNTSNTARAEAANAQGQGSIKNSIRWANFSIPPEGDKAYEQYINNILLKNAPKSLPEDLQGKNPLYKSLLDGVYAKLNAITEALSAIPRPYAEGGSGTVVSESWKENKEDYLKLVGGKFPEKPSEMDYILLKVRQGVFSPKSDDTSYNPITLSQLINEKMAINNWLLMRNNQLQERTVILTALLLSQQVAPTNLATVNSEYTRITSSQKSEAK